MSDIAMSLAESSNRRACQRNNRSRRYPASVEKSCHSSFWSGLGLALAVIRRWFELSLNFMFAPHQIEPNVYRSGVTRRFLSCLVCVLLLPVPLPMQHRHDDLDAPHELSTHLSRKHSQQANVCPSFAEMHWHFVFPTNQAGDDGQENSRPYSCTNLSGSGVSLVAFTTVMTQSSVDLLGALRSLNSVDFQAEGVANTHILVPRKSLQRDRYALSSVMRC